MAVAYFALKLKRKRQKRKSGASSANIIIIPSDNDVICRICLNRGSIPIYETKNNSNIANSIKVFGDIEIHETDGFPKHLCQACYDLLQNAINFRKNAKQSERLLLHKKQSLVEVSDYSHLVVDNDNNMSEDKTKYDDETSKSYSCNFCKLNFKTNEEYFNHANSKQHKHVRIQCNICQRLLTAKLYERHLARHKSTSHLICEVCGKLFRKDNLIRHSQLHSFELPYQCQVCPYRGRYLDSLKIHMRTHTGTKPFRCDKCELCFITRSNLNRHLLTHKKEKSLKCHECGRGFHIKRDLDTHFKSDHVGIKDFSCQVCRNKFATRKALMRHELRVHKREKMAKGCMPLYLQSEYQIHSLP